MPTDSRPGYDAPRRTREEDDLDRWRFAAELVNLVTSTPSDWSVRVGVFGRWGEGKTSVLYFIEKMLKSQGNVTFWFNPWAVTNWNELWAEFARKLVTALDEAGVAVEGLKIVKRKLLFQRAQRPVEEISGLNAAAKVAVGTALSLIRQCLQIDGPQLRAIRERLGEKRIVVIVDDLDRSDPKLVPQLLLALRDLFDLPGFAFVLGFDDQIVTTALTAYHPAWTGGPDFLEKILDFRFHLPTVSSGQRRRLLESAIPQFCPFVNLEAFDQVEDLIPSNPRKLKVLVRNLAALRSEVLRHDPDELNWVDILIAQLTKLESPEFWDRFLADGVLEEQTGIVYQINQRFRDRQTLNDDKGEDPNAKLKEYLIEWKITDSETREHIIKLVEALRSRGSANFRYQAEFASRPHRITWKEFRAVFAGWRTNHDPSTLSAWLQSQATSRSATFEDVALELFDAAEKFREQQLSRASETNSLAEHGTAMDDAHTALELIDNLLSGDIPDIGRVLRTTGNFQRILSTSMYWIHFRANPADANARAEERAFLLKFVTAESSRPDLYLEAIKPWDWEYELMPIEQPVRELQTKLRDELVRPLAHRTLEEAVRSFTVPNGIKRLNESGRLSSYRFVLLSRRSPLWSEGTLRSKLFSAFDQASTAVTVHENCIEFFELILSGMRAGLEGVSSEDLRKLAHDQEFATRLWEAVVGRKIQYRMQQHILDGRRKFIEAGTTAASMPVPDWLATRQPDHTSGSG